MMQRLKNQPWLRDPIGTVMNAEPSAKVRFGLGALLCVLFAAVSMHFCAGTEAAWVRVTAGTLCTALLMYSAWRTLRGQNTMVLLCAALMAMLAVGAHLSMLDIRPGRAGKLLEPMLADMWNYGFGTAAAWEENAWSGGYLLVMAVLSRLEDVPHVVLLKLFDMVCQSFAAVAVLHLARLRGAKPLGAVLSMLLCVLAPTMLMNAGLWAQCDAMFAMLTLWGLYLLLTAHPVFGCVFWGFALATKLQSAFLFPLLIVLFMNRKVGLRHVLVLAAVAFGAQIAILIDGQDMLSLLSRYAWQLEAARDAAILTDHAPGIFGLMNVASVREFSGMGLYFGIACALLVVYALLCAKKPLSADTLLLSALVLALGLPLVLPQMNARCLYLAGMLAFACANSPRRAAAAGLIELISLCCCIEAVFNHTVIPMTVLSLAALGVALLLTQELIAQLTEDAKGAPAHEGD